MQLGGMLSLKGITFIRQPCRERGDDDKNTIEKIWSS